MIDNKKEQERDELHRTIWNMANDLRGSVDVDFYEKITEDDVAKQLKIVIGLIYLNEAKHCVGKEAVKACFKKLLKQSEMFSDREVEVLLL